MMTRRNQKIAEKVHKNQIAFASAANLAAVSTGTETVKAILLINGGACVAMLAFSAALHPRGKSLPLAGSLVGSQSVLCSLHTIFE